MERKRILVVDDEPDLCDILSINLMTSGYAVDTAYSAEEAIKKDISRFDLILLDVMMGEMSGYDLLSKLKMDEETEHIPVLFLTAKDTESDLLHGFSLGADDYISKPFSVKEVMARVKAVLSRTSAPPPLHTPRIIHYKGLAMDIEEKSLKVDGEEVSLTRTEFDLLYKLIRQVGIVFTRQELIQSVWPEGVIVTDRTVDVNIARLRKKLGGYGNCLCSRQGYGYYLSK